MKVPRWVRLIGLRPRPRTRKTLRDSEVPEITGGTRSRPGPYAREHGVVTSADLLAPGEQAEQIADWIAPCLPCLDHLLPNDEQVRGLTGEDNLEKGCEALRELGVGTVAATRGPDGALIVGPQGAEEVPAFTVDVVDTTGCGDAFSAGFLRGLSLDRSPRDAAVLGCAARALVAQGLGTDHGDFDLAAADAFAAGAGKA